MNGATARLQHPEPASECASKDARAPVKPFGDGIERGEAVADAVIVLCGAILDHRQTGVLDPAIKDAGASAIAKVAELQLDHALGDDDFAYKARDAGRRALRRYFTNRCHVPAEADAAIDSCMDNLLMIVSMVVRDERILRTAWAN